MKVNEIARQGAMELADTTGKTSEEALERLRDKILSASSIFVAGAGRSLLALRFFAMRLMHLGLSAYVVGDTTTPAFGPEDLLIAASGSGATAGVLNTVSAARRIGGSTALFTVVPDSPIGRIADVVVQVPGYTNKIELEKAPPILPSGALFEISTLILGDALVVALGEKLGVDTNAYFSRHANLE